MHVNEPTTVLRTGEKAYVKVDVLFHKAAKAPIFSFTIRTVDGRMVYDTTTRWRNMETPDFEAGEHARSNTN